MGLNIDIDDKTLKLIIKKSFHLAFPTYEVIFSNFVEHKGPLIGVILIAGITYLLTHDAAIAIADTKLAQPILTTLFKGIGCGMLMSLATYKDSPLWMCLLCVPAFILAGFNHCIADFYYAAVGGMLGVPFLATVAGNIIGGAILLNNNWKLKS